MLARRRRVNSEVIEKREAPLEENIYSSAGKSLGFHDGSVIYDVRGRPVGQLHDSRVYTMQGHYVGELDDCMILDKNQSYASVPARGVASSSGRGIASRSGRPTSYRDISHKLFK